jgi:Glycosyltransferase sugar-binding region containing DXD motif
MERYVDVKQRIPKIISQMWIHPTDDNMAFPEECNRCRQSIIEKNPSYQYIEWKMKDVKQMFVDSPELLKFKHFYFHTLNPFQCQADFARLMVLFNSGGVYIDCDFYCLKSFDSIVNGRAFFVSIDWGHLHVLRQLSIVDSGFAIFNGVMACYPKCPLIYYLMEYIMYSWDNTGKVMGQTGPLAIGKAFTLFGLGQEGWDNERKFPDIYVSRCIINPQGYKVSKIEEQKCDCDTNEAIVVTEWVGEDGGANWQLQAAPAYASGFIDNFHLIFIGIFLLIIIIMLFIWMRNKRFEDRTK